MGSKKVLSECREQQRLRKDRVILSLLLGDPSERLSTAVTLGGLSSVVRPASKLPGFSAPFQGRSQPDRPEPDAQRGTKTLCVTQLAAAPSRLLDAQPGPARGLPPRADPRSLIPHEATAKFSECLFLETCCLAIVARRNS